MRYSRVLTERMGSIGIEHTELGETADVLPALRFGRNDKITDPTLREKTREGWGTHGKTPLKPTEGLNGPPSDDLHLMQNPMCQTRDMGYPHLFDRRVGSWRLNKTTPLKPTEGLNGPPSDDLHLMQNPMSQTRDMGHPHLFDRRVGSWLIPPRESTRERIGHPR